MIASDKIVKSVQCRYCISEFEILVNEINFKKWENGEGYIQDLLKENSTAERELFISGTCDNCWQRMFGDDCDEEE